MHQTKSHLSVQSIIVATTIFLCSCSNHNKSESDITQYNQTGIEINISEAFNEDTPQINEQLEIIKNASNKKSVKLAQKLLDITKTNKLIDKNLYLRNNILLLDANLHLINNRPTLAFKSLDKINIDILNNNQIITYYKLWAKASYLQHSYRVAIDALEKSLDFETNVENKDATIKNIVALIDIIPDKFKNNISNWSEIDSGWSELLEIVQNNTDNKTKINNITLWANNKKGYRSYQALRDGNIQANNIKSIGVILPFTGTFASSSKQILDGIITASYNDLEKTHITTCDTNQVGSAQCAKQMAEEVDFIIGPLTKEENKALGHSINNTPILPLNKSENAPSISLSDDEDIKTITDHAYNNGNYNALLVINDKNKSKGEALKRLWLKKKGTRVTTLSYETTEQVHDKLLKITNVQKSKQLVNALNAEINKKIKYNPTTYDLFDSIFIIGSYKEIKQIKPLLNYYNFSKIDTYSTSEHQLQNSKPDRDLDNIIFPSFPIGQCKNAQTSKLKQNRINKKIIDSNQSLVSNNLLFLLGADSYQIAKNYQLLHMVSFAQINGLTGDISINNHGEIKRTLPLMKINRRKCQLINDNKYVHIQNQSDIELTNI